MTARCFAVRLGGTRAAGALVLIVAGALAPAPMAAQAARVTIAPTVLSLVRRDASGVVTLTNTGSEAADFQASVHHWSSSPGGGITLVDTSDLLVAPSVFRLEPGDSRRVRVLARTTPGDREGTYRLVLAQLPEPGQPAHRGVAMRMELSVPVFVPPTQRAASADVSGATVAASRLSVDLHNTGNATITPQRITVRLLDAAKVPVGTTAVDLWYLLAGESRTLAVPIPAGACDRATHMEIDLRGDTRSSTLRTALRRDGAPCAP